MADNTQVTAGVGDTMRSKDRAGVKSQIVGLDVGIGGTEQLMTSAALADGAANPTIPAFASNGLLYNGATWDRMRGDTANGLDVDVTRLPALPTGANTIGKVDQGAPAVQANAWFDRPRKLATYRAVYRLAARPYSLSKAAGANSRTQFATIHHAATATKTVRVRTVTVGLEQSSAATFVWLDLVRITAAPATGNPAITPAIAENSDAAAEATCLALPTTAGTEGALYSTQETWLGVTGAAPTTNPAPITNTVDLIAADVRDQEQKAPTIRAGVLEGWAVIADVAGGSTIGLWIIMEFTEE